jgi:putative chitinase
MAMGRYDVGNNSLRVAAFLAQIAQESGRLRRLEENLNYSAKGLLAIWPKRFTEPLALAYARKPEKIANRVYADRLGNGPEESGDGWKYRGRGFIQLTGKSNYRAFEQASCHQVVNCPDWLLEPEPAAESAAWFFASRGLNEIADTDDIDRVSKLVNGGAHGLAERREYYRRAKVELGIA